MSDRKVHYIQYGAGWSCFTAEKPFLGLNKFHWEEGEEEEGGGGGEEEGGEEGWCSEDSHAAAVGGRGGGEDSVTAALQRRGFLECLLHDHRGGLRHEEPASSKCTCGQSHGR